MNIYQNCNLLYENLIFIQNVEVHGSFLETRSTCLSTTKFNTAIVTSKLFTAFLTNRFESLDIFHGIYSNVFHIVDFSTFCSFFCLDCFGEFVFRSFAYIVLPV